MKKNIIGISGPIGAGKSTLVRAICQMDSTFTAINLDDCRRLLLFSNTHRSYRIRSEIARLFHLEALSPQFRAELSSVIYSSFSSLRRFNDYLFQWIEGALRERIRASRHPNILIEAPFLPDLPWALLLNALVVVERSKSETLDNLNSFDLTVENIHQRWALTHQYQQYAGDGSMHFLSSELMGGNKDMQIKRLIDRLVHL